MNHLQYTDLYDFCKRKSLIDHTQDSHIIDTDNFINERLTSMTNSYQIVSRNNDINGNPYRAIILYDNNGNIILIMQARSSRPNCHKLIEYYNTYQNHAGKMYPVKIQVAQLPSFHLSPTEYNATIKLAQTDNKLYHMN
jgi:hypothetical protein